MEKIDTDENDTTNTTVATLSNSNKPSFTFIFPEYTHTIMQFMNNQAQTDQNQTSTIQIYNIQQSNPTSLINNNSINGNFNHVGIINSSASSNKPDWSNALVKPASRFSLLARRECKSTSDESYIFELNSEISSNPNNHSRLISNSARPSDISHTNSWLFSNIKTLNKGQFGFNPVCSTKMSNIFGAYLNKQYNNNDKIAIKLNSINKESGKNRVKRLTTTSKYFVEHSTKKHTDSCHNKKLFHAVSNNDHSAVVELLDSNLYDVNCADDKQRTCLHIASSRGNLDIVRLLLDYGANPNIRDCVSNLPIHLAIISSHVPVVTLLLEAGTDIHSLDLNGKTVLHLAGTRLRWLLNDENNRATPKLKFEAIMIMNMIKEYLKRKKTSTNDLDMLANKLENVFNLDDINNLTLELLNQFETLNLQTSDSSSQHHKS